MVKNELTTDQRNHLAQFLLQGSHEGRVKKGKMAEAAATYGVHKRTVKRLWAAAKKQQSNGEVIHLQSKKVMYPRGRRVHIDLELISSLPLSKRGSIRTLACGINVKKTTVGRWVKEGLIKPHTSAVRPDLTTTNKLLRLRFSLEALELDRILNILRFRNMHNTIHIDEKWFHMSKVSNRYYLIPGEMQPHRTCKSKNYIAKVMFMCAVSRPLFANDGSVLFDGKIGIFPFIQKVPAKRTSKNRCAGTLETKPTDSVTRNVTRDMLIHQMLPIIKAKWPEFASKTIYIQQDNAKPHIDNDDPIWRQHACSDGFTFILVQQPPNSPDTNVNDLGWFRAIQSLQNETCCKTVDQLIEAVCLSFERLEPQKLNKVFLSLQGCMVEIMKIRGQNCYKIPHMKKDACIREGTLPLNLDVPADLVEECITHLVEVGCLDQIGGIMHKLGVDRVENQ